MITVLARNWWAIVIRGIVAVLFGILAVAVPGLALRALILLFGTYALADGAFALTTALTGTGSASRGALVLEGIISIAAGIVTVVWPDLTALTLLYFIAFWAILTGIAEVATAIRIRHEVTGEWLLALAGMLSILFGIVCVVFPRSGALSLIILIGVYALIFGVILIGLGLRLRNYDGGRLRSANEASV